MISSINKAYAKAAKEGRLEEYKQSCRETNQPMLEVVGNFIVVDDRILLLFKKARQYYELVGGKIEPGETIVQAAKREALEEIGCVVKVEDYHGFADFGAGDDIIRGHHVISHIVSGSPRIMETDVFDHLKWIASSELDKYPHSKNIDAFFHHN